MIGASRKGINFVRVEHGFNFPENSVRGVLDFSKCGMNVGAPTFRIFKGCWVQVGGQFPEKHSLKRCFLRKKGLKFI